MNSEENKITEMSLPGILKKINFSGKNNNENWIDKFSEFVREIIKLSDGKVGWFKKIRIWKIVRLNFMNVI